ncbi:MAG: type IX secretion system outer membrane channel protein PorV [Chitinophagaceae bacterium]|nr:type IX secretion system outer membrane channel protein PorV [Chitinophagaceae bacterium]
MKHSFKRFYLAGVLLMGLTAKTFAQADTINIVTTAVPFLRISPDARAGGMGDQGISTSADASSQFYNVAKYPFAKTPYGVSATYTPWLKDLGLNDVYLASLAGFYKLDDQQAISASLRYFSLGRIQFTDANGNDLNEGRPRELGLDLGYSRKLSEKLSLGIALRYIYSNLAANAPSSGTAYKPGNAVSGDIGIYYNGANEEGQGWSIGAAFSNLGTKISYTSDAAQKNFIPANLGIGVGHTWVTNEVHKISLNGELNKLLVPAPPGQGSTATDYEKYNSEGVVSGWLKSFGNSAMAYSAGGEYTYNDQFALRLGYYADTRSMGKRSYFTAGVGINYSVMGLNFSYLLPSGNGVNRNPLSNTIRIGLVFNLGGEAAGE